jgi:hypothetical protein
MGIVQGFEHSFQGTLYEGGRIHLIDVISFNKSENLFKEAKCLLGRPLRSLSDNTGYLRKGNQNRCKNGGNSYPDG